MHPQLPDIGAMRLIGRVTQPELDRPDDLGAEPCGQQYGIPCGDRARDLPKEDERLIMRERRHEADAGAAFDTVDQYISQLIEQIIGTRRIDSNDFGPCDHAARSSFDATVASALRR